MRKILLTGLGMAVAGALTLSGNMTGLAASAQPGGWFTVSGTVTDVSGPVHVWLYAWPSAAIVRSLRPGQRVPLKVLGEQTTSTGQYALSVNPATLPGGIVNRARACPILNSELVVETCTAITLAPGTSVRPENAARRPGSM